MVLPLPSFRSVSLETTCTFTHIHPITPDQTSKPHSPSLSILTTPPSAQLQRSPGLPTHPPHPLAPASQILRNPTLPHRKHPCPNLHVRARRNGYLSRRLFRHPDGRARNQFPLQRLRRSHVPRLDALVLSDRALVRKTRWVDVDRAGSCCV